MIHRSYSLNPGLNLTENYLGSFDDKSPCKRNDPCNINNDQTIPNLSIKDDQKSISNRSINSSSAQYTKKELREMKFKSIETINKEFKRLKINNSNLILSHYNARSLVKHQDNLDDYINSFDVKFSIIGITETWETESSPLPDIENYDCHSQFRKHKRGGGCCIYIKQGIKYKYRKDLSIFDESKIETIFIELTPAKGRNKIIGIVYRPPGASYEASIVALENIISKTARKGKHIYLMGDVNYNLLASETSKPTRDFLDMLSAYGITPLINSPTRVSAKSSSCIDNIYSSQDSIISSGTIATDIIDSDHLPVYAVMDKILNKLTFEKYIHFRSYSDHNKERFREKLKKTDFSPVYNETEPNKIIDAFDKIFNPLYYACFPKKRKKVKITETKKPWIKDELLELRNEKEAAFRKNLLEPSPENEKEYKELRNKFTQRERTAQRKYNENRLNNAKNSKEKWSILNGISRRKSKNKDEIRELEVENETITDPKEIASCFNNYFTNIGPNLAQNIEATPISPNDYLKDRVENTFEFSHISEIATEKLINSAFSKSKAPGLDEINGSILKENSDILSLPISFAINASLAHGIFPDKLKIASITPIFKNVDSKTNHSNYRPISLLPAVSKLFEKTIVLQLTKFFNDNNVFSNSQYGFRNKHNTSHAITNLLEIISEAIENGEYTLAIFLDLQKAFDTVNHKILLDKLEFYGIRGVPLRLIQNYLSNRKQLVKIQNSFSDPLDVLCGIPQGSILGPLLFIIYINDLCHVSESIRYILFADDSNIVKSDTDLERLAEDMSIEFSKISDWLIANKLSLHVMKTKFIVFCTSQRNSNPSVTVNFGDNDLSQVQSTKFLGVHVDQHLTWSNHLKHVTDKLKNISGIIYRTKHKLPETALVNLYKSLALPHLLYCNIIWGAAHETALDPVYKMQKRIIRNITNSEFLAHTSPLFKELELLKLPDLNEHETLKFIYNYEQEHLPGSLLSNKIPKCHDIHSYYTRQQEHYHLKHYDTNIAFNSSVISRGLFKWNELNPSIRSENSFKAFSNKVKSDIIQSY